MDAIEQASMMSADVPDDVQGLQPAGQLGSRQAVGIRDRILHSSRSEAEQAGQAAPVENFNSDPNWQKATVALSMMFHEVLAGPFDLFFKHLAPSAVDILLSCCRSQLLDVEMCTGIDTAQLVSQRRADGQFDRRQGGESRGAESSIELVESEDV